MTTLERQARALWHAWADYMQYGICDGCGAHAYVGRTPRSRWLCLACWDAGKR